jgi:16S rRNA (adenine1518-N6/adenine1519-N6)-dimethyltransferase
LIVETAPWPIVEIGPGLGALTRPLLSLGASVAAVELDRGLAAALREWPEARPGGPLNVVEADALALDLARDLGPGPHLVCGNLPYNISSPLILWLLSQLQAAPKAVFTLQKEMAERLSAKPGSRDYGRLTVAASLRCQVEALMEIGPEAFRPRPKVASQVIRLSAKPGPEVVSAEALGRLTAAAFHARRKTILNNLSGSYGRERAAAALAAAGVAPDLRPETISPETLAALALDLEKAGD